MSKIVIPFIIITVLLAGCTQQNVDVIFNNLPQVQAFLNEHSNAEMIMNYWTIEEVNNSINEISADCEKNMTVQPMYFARVSEGNFEVTAWFDSSYTPLCVIKKDNAAAQEPVIPVNQSINITGNETDDDEHDSEDQEDEKEYALAKEVNDYNCVTLTWTPYEGADLKYYKVVRSETNEHPKYPDDGYIEVISSRLTNYYTDCSAENGKYYYGITMVTTNHGSLYTNPVEVELEFEQENDSHDQTNNSEEQELAYEVVLMRSNVSVPENCLNLSWTPWPEDITYYKVVRSTTNNDPKYPEDSYIAVISDRESTQYLDCEWNSNATTYYRITTVLENSSKVHSNVLTINAE